MWGNYKEFAHNRFLISSKFSASFFLLTLKVMASSTHFLRSLKTLIYKSIIERLNINPNFKKQNDDYRLKFFVSKFYYIFFYILSSKFEFFYIFIKITHNFVTSPVASFIAILCKIFNQILISFLRTRKLPKPLKWKELFWISLTFSGPKTMIDFDREFY